MENKTKNKTIFVIIWVICIIMGSISLMYSNIPTFFNYMMLGVILTLIIRHGRKSRKKWVKTKDL